MGLHSPYAVCKAAETTQNEVGVILPNTGQEHVCALALTREQRRASSRMQSQEPDSRNMKHVP